MMYAARRIITFAGILVSNTSGQTPFQVAESGGRHAGFLRQRQGKAPDDLLREAQKLRQRATEHADKIKNRIGYSKVSDDPVIQAQAEAGRTRHLQKEIDMFTQQAEILEELARRKAAGGP
jgi:hypothetical protein